MYKGQSLMPYSQSTETMEVAEVDRENTSLVIRDGRKAIIVKPKDLIGFLQSKFNYIPGEGSVDSLLNSKAEVEVHKFQQNTQLLIVRSNGSLGYFVANNDGCQQVDIYTACFVAAEGNKVSELGKPKHLNNLVSRYHNIIPEGEMNIKAQPVITIQ